MGSRARSVGRFGRAALAAAAVAAGAGGEARGGDAPAALGEDARKALAALKRQGEAIVTCRLDGTHFAFLPGLADTKLGEELKGGIDIGPDETFAALRAGPARASADAVLDALQRLLAGKGAAVDTRSGDRFHFAMEGPKTRWDYFDGDKIVHRIVFDGSHWISDSDVSNNQTTIRTADTIATETLDTYRFVPHGLADIAGELTAAPALPFSLAVGYPGRRAEYGLGAGPVTEYAGVRNEAGRVGNQIFQFFLRPDWAAVGLPSVRVDCSYDRGGRMASVNMYRVLAAEVNRDVPAGEFRVPLKAGRLLVDERRSPPVPTRVGRADPDALGYAGRPEADAVRRQLADPEEVGKAVQNGGETGTSSRYRVLLVAAIAVMTVIAICIVWYRRRSLSRPH